MAAAGGLPRTLLLLLVLLAVALSSEAPVAAALDHHGRQLLQSAVSCPAQIPACMPRRCTSRILNNRETYVCLRCAPSYVPVRGSDSKSIVQCVCPPGTYQSRPGSTRQCQPCEIGSWCPGGNSRARTANDNIGGDLNPCNPNGTAGLTTTAKKAVKFTDCVAMAGYVLPASPGRPAPECPVSTYSPANNRLRNCLRCQSGLAEAPDYKANGGLRTNRQEVCRVPPGKFWELNVVRDCPVGMYREGYVNTTDPAAIQCRSCPEGWTTQGKAKGMMLDCNRLLPGRKVVTVTAGQQSISAPDKSEVPTSTVAGEATELCPYGFYFNGTDGWYGCRACPLGTTTQQTGSTSVDDCLVPPGYYIHSMDGGLTGHLAKCPNNFTTDNTKPPSGYYRSGWVAPSKALGADGSTGCTPCGEGILSRPMQPDERLDLAGEQDANSSDPDFGYVASLPVSCYIQSGWGITFDMNDFSKMRAIIPCPENTYGVAQETFGLTVAPCKACSKNLKSPPGSTSFEACVNDAGYGYTSEGANQCPDGFWAEAGKMAPCEQCPEGRYTEYVAGNGVHQSSQDSCKVLPGHGVYSAAATDAWNPNMRSSNLNAKPCPVGYFSAGDAVGLDVNGTTNPVCQVCPGLEWTTQEGSASCNACKPGAGVDVGNCQPCPYNTYQPGPSGIHDGLTCKPCPSTTFNHYTGEPFTSYGITFWTSMANPYLCVPRFSQAASPAGHTLGLTDEVFIVVPDQATVRDCVTACPTDVCCIAEFNVSDTGESKCRHATLPPARPVALIKSVEDDVPRLYYKLPPSELISSASVNDTRRTSGGGSSSSSAATSSASILTDKQHECNKTTSLTECEDAVVKAKTQASGIFAVCDMTSWQSYAVDGLIGTSPIPGRVESGRSAIDWNVPGACDSKSACYASCMTDATCWGFVYVPDHGFALRTGEMTEGVRSFFVSPDLAQTRVAANGLSVADSAALQGRA